MGESVPGMRALTVVLVAIAAGVYGAVLAGVGSGALAHRALDRLAVRDACLVALVTLDAVPPRRGC
ncbi:hypothetical protein SH611_12545 [Geminicoccaceae bacterium 1502E]|nr:hypothetical protein [Geminicoccaceae bacterium 1502E]